jgi:hypothetical protein
LEFSPAYSIHQFCLLPPHDPAKNSRMGLTDPLLSLLPMLLPLATRWVQDREAEILTHGAPLTPQQHKDAEAAGVRSPEKIRLQVVREIPLPINPVLAKVARQTGLLGPATAGLTLHYGIYIRHDVQSNRELHVHEFVHGGQYERLGSIEAFLAPYLRECLDPGYPLGPMEQEAILTARKIIHGD